MTKTHTSSLKAVVERQIETEALFQTEMHSEEEEELEEEEREEEEREVSMMRFSHSQTRTAISRLPSLQTFPSCDFPACRHE